MTDFVWFPVTGDGQSVATQYVWNVGTFAFNTAADWVNIDILVNPYLTGVVPGSGATNGMNVSNGPADAAYLVSGAAATFLLNPPFYTPNPSRGDPYIASGPGATTNFPVSVLLNSGSVVLATLGLGQASFAATPIYPTLDIEGASLHVTGNVLDTFTKTFPQPFGTQTASGGGTIDLGTGATFEVGGTVGTAGTPDIIVNFNDGLSDLLKLDGVSAAASGAFAGQVTGFVLGDKINLPNVPFAGLGPPVYNPITDTLTLMNGATVEAALQITGSYTSSSFRLLPDGAGTDVVLCFAAGTRLRTERGEVAVEALTAGDRVASRTNDGEELRPITWIGRRRIDIAAHPDPEAVLPIRILRDAVGPGLPARDLLVSPDHAIHLDGALIPARMLVNGASVVQDTGLRTVTYFHVELAEHAILFAEALETESYLDTGNRAMFENAGPMMLHPDFSLRARLRHRAAATCVPLGVTEAVVRPVWTRLATRAAALGHTAPPPAPTTRDPAARLRVAGRELRPVMADESRLIFVLRPGCGDVRLVSRTARPGAVHPWRDDRRRLGLAVGRMLVRHGAAVTEIPPDHPDLAEGWWDVEGDGPRIWRWTAGEARLILPPDATMLEIRLAATTEYPAEAPAGAPAISALAA